MWLFQSETALSVCLICVQGNPDAHSLCSTTQSCPKGMRLNESHIQMPGACTNGQESVAALSYHWIRAQVREDGDVPEASYYFNSD